MAIRKANTLDKVRNAPKPASSSMSVEGRDAVYKQQAGLAKSGKAPDMKALGDALRADLQDGSMSRAKVGLRELGLVAKLHGDTLPDAIKLNDFDAAAVGRVLSQDLMPETAGRIIWKQGPWEATDKAKESVNILADVVGTGALTMDEGALNSVLKAIDDAVSGAKFPGAEDLVVYGKSRIKSKAEHLALMRDLKAGILPEAVSNAGVVGDGSTSVANADIGGKKPMSKASPLNTRMMLMLGGPIEPTAS